MYPFVPTSLEVRDHGSDIYRVIPAIRDIFLAEGKGVGADALIKLQGDH